MQLRCCLNIHHALGAQLLVRHNNPPAERRTTTGSGSCTGVQARIRWQHAQGRGKWTFNIFKQNMGYQMSSPTCSDV